MSRVNHDQKKENADKPNGRRNPALALKVAQSLTRRDEKLVCAESCTGGMVSASLVTVPGISEHFCGSLVTYRATSKCRWLKVKQKTIDDHTTESIEVAQEMATGALKVTPEATWSAAVVGHLGPDAPQKKDGHIYLCIARQGPKNKAQIKHTSEHTLAPGPRAHRQRCATEIVLATLARILKEEKEEA